jgi:hypothetical protein
MNMIHKSSYPATISAVSSSIQSMMLSSCARHAATANFKIVMSRHGNCTLNVRDNLIRFCSTQFICILFGE